jgi:hypothetical protein
MRKYLFLLLMFGAITASAQDAYWKKWNAAYPLYDVATMLKKEHAKAIQTDKNPKLPQYYFRKAKYRFKATIMGATSNINPETFNAIKRLYKQTGGDPALLTRLFKKSVLVKVGNDMIWMPIQDKVLDGLKNEMEKGDVATIYCLYLNEHTTNHILHNYFLISEFKKDI